MAIYELFDKIAGFQQISNGKSMGSTEGTKGTEATEGTDFARLIYALELTVASV